MSLKQTLRGTGVALVTPFKQNKEVDVEAFTRVVNHVIQNGVDYVVVLGTTGETPTLSRAEKELLINHTYDIVNGKVPIVVGVGGNDTLAVARELQALPLQHAAAVLSASPYYNKPSQEGIFQHYQYIASASPRPIILYNVPGRTGRNMSPETTIRLASEVSNIAGIKEAASDITQAMKIVKDCPDDFLVVSGDDDLVLPEIAAGMDGVISVAANCFPQKFSSMVQHALSGNFSEAKLLNDQMMEAYTLLFAENNPAGVKAFLHEMGMIGPDLRLPLVPVSNALLQKIRNYLSAG